MMIWLKYYYGVNFHELCPSVQAIKSRVKNLQKKVQKLCRDTKKTDIEVMKSLPFDLPESRKSESFQEDLKRKHTESVLKVNFKESSVSHTLYASTISACNSLANELCEVKESLTTEQEKKEKIKAKCESQKSVCRNLTRQLKRRSVAPDRQKEEKKTLEKEVAIKNKEISKLRKELDSKGEKIENYKTKVSETRKEKKNVQELNRYHRKRNSDLKNVHPIGALQCSFNLTERIQ